MSWVYFNHEFVKEEQAQLSYRDLSVQRGYGIFDFFRVHQAQPVFLEDHLARFFYSAEQMHLPVPKTAKEIRHLILELIRSNRIENSGIRITLTGGLSPDGYQPGTPFLIIAEQPFTPLSQEVLNKGIHLISYPFQRQLPHVKTIDYITPIWLQPYLRQQGGDDLLYHQHDRISECPRSNFFLIDQENRLLTPSGNILKGITRKHVLKLAAQHFTIAEKTITLSDLRNAREAFTTSTTKWLLPVVQIDGQTIGTGKPGETTMKLRKMLEEEIIGIQNAKVKM
jgi:branched-chain amino acid aminotransferase